MGLIARQETAPEKSNGAPVGKGGRVEGAHVADFLQIDVAVEQLLVAAVDDGGPV